MGGNNFYKLVGHMYKNPLPITSLWGRGGQINIINLKTYNMATVGIIIGSVLILLGIIKVAHTMYVDYHWNIGQNITCDVEEAVEQRNNH